MSAMYVLDASVALRWFLEEERHPHADRALDLLLEYPYRFAVPELFAFEVFAVLCRLHPSPVEAYVHGVVPILQNGMLRHPMTEGLARGAARFTSLGLSGYDAVYAALAKEIGAMWLTFDARAHKVASTERVSWLLSESLPPSL